MDLITSLRLEFCVPLEWTVDLTPPHPWEAVVKPLTPKELLEAFNGSFEAMAQAFNPIYKYALPAAMEEIVKTIEAQMQGLVKPVEYMTTVEKVLTSFELEKHGTREAPQYQKNGIVLPRKITNTGPPQDRFKRRGR